MNKGTPFTEYLSEKLRDPKLASRYISEALTENDPDYLKVALGDIVKAHGITNISEQTGISRQSLYKMLSEDGNPTHKNLLAILDVLGLELIVRPKRSLAS